MAGQTPTASVSRKQAAWSPVPASELLGFACVAGSGAIAFIILTVHLQLTDGLATAMTALVAMGTVFFLTPPLIRKMEAAGMVGVDVRKLTKVQVAELGGIAALFAFSISLSLVVGIQKLLGDIAEPPFLAAISVFFMASMVGLIDDISDLRQSLKAIAVAIAALPLMLVHLGAPVISFPFGFSLDFTGELHLFYWLILVPIGVTGVANAMNMSAGYNGLETGQVATISMSLLIVAQVRGSPDVSLLVLGAVFGCAAGLFYFNRFPARVFVGDIGTLGLGAAIAAGVILGHIEFYGIVAMAPAFYELAATAYYGLTMDNRERRRAHKNPIIEANGVLRPPPGAEHYTLSYLVLSKHPMTEKALVRTLILLYALSGTAAVLLSVL